MEKNFFTVYQINSYIRQVLEEDIILSDLFIKGEITNFKKHWSEHMYFSLKDEYSAINCVMFKSYAKNLTFTPKNGMKVLIQGEIGLYEKTGNYQVYVKHLEEDGKGNMQLAFEELKNKLYSEGLFLNKYKKELPKYPETIVLITSKTGSVVKDMIKIAKRRNPNIKIIIMPVSVQGKEAVDSIKFAIKKINKLNKGEIIILARGGGSLEDLSVFNSEEIARSIFSSKIPIISAIGHETDFTISDFVADLRAATPSEAIEISVPDINILKNTLYEKYEKIQFLLENKLNIQKRVFYKILNKRILKDPLVNVYNKEIYVNQLEKIINKEMHNKLEKSKDKLEILSNNLEYVSPLNILNKGYSLVYKDDNIIKNIKKLKLSDEIKIKLSNGTIIALIKILKEDKNA